jgi:hypothetical protein
VTGCPDHLFGVWRSLDFDRVKRPWRPVPGRLFPSHLIYISSRVSRSSRSSLSCFLSLMISLSISIATTSSRQVGRILDARPHRFFPAANTTQGLVIVGATVFHLSRTPVAAASAKMPSELKQRRTAIRRTSAEGQGFQILEGLSTCSLILCKTKLKPCRRDPVRYDRGFWVSSRGHRDHEPAPSRTCSRGHHGGQAPMPINSVNLKPTLSGRVLLALVVEEPSRAMRFARLGKNAPTREAPRRAG